MPKYRVYRTWTMIGYDEVEADSEDDAEFSTQENNLPDNGSYISGSIQLDRVEAVKDEEE